MEPQKSMVLPIALTVLVSALVFGAGGYYLANYTNQVATSTPTPVSTITSAVKATPTATSTLTPRPTSSPVSNKYDQETAKVGDVFGAFKLITKGGLNYSGDTFEGTAEISGVVENSSQPFAGGVCFTSFSTNSKAFIPIRVENSEPRKLCLNGDQITTTEFPVGIKWSATVNITKIQFTCSSDCDSTNDLGTVSKVVSKTKI